MFAIQSMVHAAIQHTPSQVVFARATILNINQEANWQSIKLYKLALVVIRKNIDVEDNLMCTAMETNSY